MSPSLFWIDEVPATGGIAELSGPEGRHAVAVTRIVAGQEISLSDGRGVVARCRVEETVGKDALRATVLIRRVDPAPAPAVMLVQALPKSDRSELAVELATEAGIDAIVPWQARRCVAQWSGPKAVKGVAKWRGTAAVAAKQSRRSRIPEVADLASTADVTTLIAEAVADGAVVAVLHEAAGRPFAELPLAEATSIVLVVGPEGGLDDAEIAALSQVGGHSVVLGPTVLRTSTAAAVALGAIGALTPRWG